MQSRGGALQHQICSETLFCFFFFFVKLRKKHDISFENRINATLFLMSRTPTVSHHVNEHGNGVFKKIHYKDTALPVQLSP